MAELTISELRNLDVLGSSLLFAVDGDKETFNISLSTLFDYTKERMGLLETGSVEMYMGEVIPETHTELDGKTFDPLVFPKMGALFPTGALPDTRGMTLKHAPNGRLVLSFEAESVKNHSHTASQQAHAHSRGSMEIWGNVNSLWTEDKFATGAFEDTEQSNLVQQGTGPIPGHNGMIRFLASKSWTGETSQAAPQITVNPNGSAKNLVDNIAVKFIIKKA